MTFVLLRDTKFYFYNYFFTSQLNFNNNNDYLRKNGFILAKGPKILVVKSE